MNEIHRRPPAVDLHRNNMPSPSACFAPPAPISLRRPLAPTPSPPPHKRPSLLSSQSPPARPVRHLTPGVTILLQTPHYLAVSKPPGLLVHRTKLDRTRAGDRFLVNELRLSLSPASGPPVGVYPLHRLDRSTSGVLLFALHSPAHAASLQTALRAAAKDYWALAAGAGMQRKWVNDHPLKDLTGKARVQRAARTEFEQMLWLPEADVSVVRARLRSGRRHQIRRHLSNSRFPILGDTSYAKGRLNRRVREEFGVGRCCLHARRLAFDDPFEGRRVTVEAEVPEDLVSVLRKLPGYVPDEHDQLVDLVPAQSPC